MRSASSNWEAHVLEVRQRAARREVLAAAALPGVLTASALAGLTPAEVAAGACNIADALMAELESRRQAEELA